MSISSNRAKLGAAVLGATLALGAAASAQVVNCGNWICGGGSGGGSPVTDFLTNDNDSNILTNDAGSNQLTPP